MEKGELKIRHGDLRKKPAALKERGQSIDDFNPLLVLFEHMRQQNLRLIDLFRNLDANNDHNITSDEIQAGLAVRYFQRWQKDFFSLSESLLLVNNEKLTYKIFD